MFIVIILKLKKTLFGSSSRALARLGDLVVPGEILLVGVVGVQRRLGPDEVSPAHVQVGNRPYVLVVQGKVPNLEVLNNSKINE